MKTIKKKINRLSLMLGIGGLNGSIALSALAGLFTMENALIIGCLFIAGPGAILTAVLIEGPVKERVLVALVSGVIATSLIMFSAGVGPNLLKFLNLQVLKIAGGLAVGVIALMIAGVKVPNNLPLGIVVIGLIVGGILR